MWNNLPNVWRSHSRQRSEERKENKGRHQLDHSLELNHIHQERCLFYLRFRHDFWREMIVKDLKMCLISLELFDIRVSFDLRLFLLVELSWRAQKWLLLLIHALFERFEVSLNLRSKELWICRQKVLLW